LSPSSSRQEGSGSIGELADQLAGSAVIVAQEPPAASAERIAIYARGPSADKPGGAASPSRAPLAFLFKGQSMLNLWPVPPYQFDAFGAAWSILLDQCRRYFDPHSDADTNMSYACYHCTTMTNLSAGTYWWRVGKDVCEWRLASTSPAADSCRRS
jgi:hypothetical protein